MLITGRNPEKLQQTSAELGKDGSAISYLQWDISADTDLQELLNKVKKQLGGIDCWVNNAGIYPGKLSYANAAAESWDRVFDTNLKGAYFATNAVVSYMIQNQIRGNILTISSETGS